jgi:hypothetical protein
VAGAPGSTHTAGPSGIPSPQVNEPVGVLPEPELNGDDVDDEDAPQVDLEPLASAVAPPEPPVPVTLSPAEHSFAEGLFEEASTAPSGGTTPSEVAPEPEPAKPTRAKRTSTTTRKKTTPPATSATPAAKPKRTSTRKKKTESTEADE